MFVASLWTAANNLLYYNNLNALWIDALYDYSYIKSVKLLSELRAL